MRADFELSAIDRRDPYPDLAILREGHPVHRDSDGGWLILRHADIGALLRDPRLGKDLRRWTDYARERPYGAGSTAERYIEQWMDSRLPAKHARWRRLAAQAFTPRAMANVRRRVESIADDLCAKLPAAGTVEVMAAFAHPFPILVVMSVLDLPMGDYERLRSWSDYVSSVLEPTAAAEKKSESAAATESLIDYLRGQVDARRSAPRDDLLSGLIAAEDAGERLSTEELIAMVLLLFLAGNETSANLVANGLLALLRHPAQLARLRAQPELLASAVEETLRYDASASVLLRAAYEPVQIHGEEIPEGALVKLILAAGNRDGRVFRDPEMFDVTRDPNPHLTFGGGAHFCIGAPLARIEGRVAFRRLLAQWREIRVEESGIEWLDTVYLRGMKQLTISVAS